MTHVGTETLETARLRLRRIEPRDAGALYEMLSDERTMRFIRVPRYTDFSLAEKYIESALERYAQPDRYYWVIELRDGGQFIGTVSLHSLSEQDEVAEVGYCVTPAEWGNGYMSEALRAVIEFAFRQVGYNRVEAGHSTQNPASGAVMRKAGMLYEGMAREKYKNAYGYYDTHQYGILKKDL